MHEPAARISIPAAVSPTATRAFTCSPRRGLGGEVCTGDGLRGGVGVERGGRELWWSVGGRASAGRRAGAGGCAAALRRSVAVERHASGGARRGRRAARLLRGRALRSRLRLGGEARRSEGLRRGEASRGGAQGRRAARLRRGRALRSSCLGREARRGGGLRGCFAAKRCGEASGSSVVVERSGRA